MIVDIEKVVTQRDMFRTLVKRYGAKNKAAIVRAYVRAEQEGKVIRLRNRTGRDAWEYATQLWYNYQSQGW